LLNRFNTLQNRRRKALEDVADEKEFQLMNEAFKKITTERRDKQNPDKPTITEEYIDELVKDGLRDKPFLKLLYKVARRQEDLSHLGDEDNEPDKGYLDDIKKIEKKAIADGMTIPQLKNALNKISEKARLEVQHKSRNSAAPGTRLSEANLTSVELTRIDGAIATVIKNFQDEGKQNFENQKKQARQAIRRLYGGSDQFMQKFNMKRENLLADVYNTARLLIKGGERWDVAVEKVRPLVQEVTAVGINRFKGVTARDLVIKARKGQLTDEARFVLEAMAARKREREAKEIKTIKEGLKQDVGRGTTTKEKAAQTLKEEKQRIIDPGLPQKKEKKTK
jgi:hypothetical protein